MLTDMLRYAERQSNHARWPEFLAFRWIEDMSTSASDDPMYAIVPLFLNINSCLCSPWLSILARYAAFCVATIGRSQVQCERIACCRCHILLPWAVAGRSWLRIVAQSPRAYLELSTCERTAKAFDNSNTWHQGCLHVGYGSLALWCQDSELIICDDPACNNNAAKSVLSYSFEANIIFVPLVLWILG